MTMPRLEFASCSFKLELERPRITVPVKTDRRFNPLALRPIDGDSMNGARRFDAAHLQTASVVDT